MLRSGLLATGLLFSGLAFASILPPNDLHLQDDITRKDANLTEARFLELSEQVMAYYRPIVESHGGVLNLDANWRDSTVNAYANRTGSTWNVAMFGGLARRPEVTEDGYQLVVCHELGHHLAGFPTYGFGNWASSEGQSDYFATQACARNIWGDDVATNANFRTTATASAKSECNAAWTTENEQNLCYRIQAAGYSLASLLGGATYARRDSNVVRSTVTSHPASQCRFDTYRAGGLCTVDFDENTIPRTLSDIKDSSCVRSAGYTIEARPVCWYKP